MFQEVQPVPAQCTVSFPVPRTRRRHCRRTSTEEFLHTNYGVAITDVSLGCGNLNTCASHLRSQFIVIVVAEEVVVVVVVVEVVVVVVVVVVEEGIVIRTWE